MVGRGNDDRVDVAVFQQAAKVVVCLDAAANEPDRFIEPSTVRLGYRHHVNVGLLFEIDDVTFSGIDRRRPLFHSRLAELLLFRMAPQR